MIDLASLGLNQISLAVSDICGSEWDFENGDIQYGGIVHLLVHVTVLVLDLSLNRTGDINALVIEIRDL
jgi:hypothetical protein